MTGKSKLIIIVVLFISCIGIAVWHYLSKKELLEYIPSFASSVIIINTGSIASELIIDQITDDTEIDSELLKFIPDSLRHINILKSGIDVTSRIAIFSIYDSTTTKSDYCCIIPVGDPSKLKEFVTEEISSVLGLYYDNDFGMYISDSNQLFIKVQKEVAYIVKSEQERDRVNSTLNSIINSEISLLEADSTFRYLVNNEAKIQALISPLQDTIFKSIENIKASKVLCWLDFTKKKWTLEIDIESDNQNTFLSALSKDTISIPTSESLLSVKISLDTNKLRDGSVFGNNPKVADLFKDITTKTDGVIAISLFGIDSVKQESVQYEYDDNFNRTAIVTTNFVPYPQICLSASMQEDLMNRTITSFAKKGSITDSSLSTNYTQAPIFYNYKNPYLLLGTDKNSVFDDQYEEFSGLKIKVSPSQLKDKTEQYIRSFWTGIDSLDTDIPSSFELSCFPTDTNKWTFHTQIEYSEKHAVTGLLNAVDYMITRRQDDK